MNKKHYLQRLLLIYIAFFVILLTGFLLNIVPNVSRGFKAGNVIGNEMVDSYNEPDPRSIYMLWNIPIYRSEPITICDGEASREVIGHLSNLTLEVKEPAGDRAMMHLAFAAIGNSPWIYALMILSALTYPAIIVLMFCIIRSVRCSIREEKPLGNSNAIMLRTIALLTIVGELFNSIGAWMMTLRAAEVLTNTAYAVDTAFHLNYSTLIMGILLLFAAEVFKISRDIGEEQRLTI